MPTSDPQEVLLEGMGPPLADPSGLYPNPVPVGARAPMLQHRANLWQPTEVSASDSEVSAGSFIWRYDHIAARRRTLDMRSDSSLLGNWPGDTTANLEVWIFPPTTRVDQGWAIVDHSTNADGSTADSDGLCWIVQGPPRKVPGWPVMDAAKVEVLALLQPKPPTGVS